MLLWVLPMLAGIVAVSLLTGLIWVRLLSPDAAAAQQGWRCRLLTAQRGLVYALGRPVAALSVLLAGAGAVAVICWPLGRVARRLEDPVDVPLLRFVQRHNHYSSWTRLNEVLTLMGNRPQVKIVCAAAAVVLTFLWRRRGWYVPAVAIATAFALEKFLQQMLARVVARGQPPIPGLGTYPSGGCARLIAIYGIILFLFLRMLPHISRRTRLACWSVLGAAAFVEGYTRVYLLKHWFTDVLGGWVFGVLLLVVLIAATATLAPPARRSDSNESASGAAQADRISVSAV